MEQGPLGLNPELRTPPLPATHVRAGTGHRVLARNYTTDKVGPPTCEFTRYVRPRVATAPGCPPADGFTPRRPGQHGRAGAAWPARPQLRRPDPCGGDRGSPGLRDRSRSALPGSLT